MKTYISRLIDVPYDFEYGSKYALKWREVDAVTLVYTRFVSTVQTIDRLLPAGTKILAIRVKFLTRFRTPSTNRAFQEFWTRGVSLLIIAGVA